MKYDDRPLWEQRKPTTFKSNLPDSSNIKSERARLPESYEVMAKMDKEKRQPKASPLLEEYMQRQAERRKGTAE